MILVKIAMVGIAIAVLMVVAQQKRWPARAGIIGSCVMTQPHAAEAGYWYACKEGVLTGFPVLEADSCSSAGMVAKQEYWVCTAPLSSIPGF